MSKITLKNIEPYWPQLEYEGCKNLWVVKPAAQFCGRGIKVFKTVEDVISHVDITADNKTTQHIVQKYIGNCHILFVSCTVYGPEQLLYFNSAIIIKYIYFRLVHQLQMGLSNKNRL